MNWTGGADRHGPAPNACEGNQKARSGAASPQGFTVRCFSGCGQGLALQGSSANEGRFRLFRLSGPRKCRPVSLGRFDWFWSNPSAPARAGNLKFGPALCRAGSFGQAGRRPARPGPASRTKAGVIGRARMQTSAGEQVGLRSIVALSARAWRGPARPDSRRRPPRSPRPWRASAHKGRCRAARLSPVRAKAAA